MDLSGIAGKINVYLDFEASKLVPTVVPFFLLTTPDRSLMVIVKWFPESAIMHWVKWDYRFKQRRKCFYSKKGQEKLSCKEYIHEKRDLEGVQDANLKDIVYLSLV